MEEADEADDADVVLLVTELGKRPATAALVRGKKKSKTSLHALPIASRFFLSSPLPSISSSQKRMLQCAVHSI